MRDLKLIQELLTDQEIQNLSLMLNRKYSGYLKDRFFEIEAKQAGTLSQVTVTLKNQKTSFFYPVEARMRLDHTTMSLRSACLFLIDYIESYFEEYLHADENVYLPIDWADYECDGIAFQMKGQILNLELEKLADLWLEGKEDLNLENANRLPTPR